MSTQTCQYTERLRAVGEPIPLSPRFCDRRPNTAGAMAGVFGGFLMAGVLLTSGCAQNQDPITPPSPSPQGRSVGKAEAVQVAVVEAMDLTPTLSLVGTVVAARRSVVGSAVDGRVVQADFEAGDAVAGPGKAIAQLSTETISIEIASAEAELELRRHRLAEQEAGSRLEEIAQTKARWEAAKATMKYSQARFDRLTSLFQQAQSASREEFEEARSAALAAAQAMAAAQAVYDLAVAGPRSEQIQQARASVAQQEEEVKRLEDLRAKHTIHAPFPGYVLAKHTEVGAWLTRGDPIAEIAELDPIDVEVSVPESLISHVHLEDQIPVTIGALPEDGRVFEGTVDRIVPSADLRARSFPVKVRLRNPMTADGHRLKDGMLARVSMSGRPFKALVVPKASVIMGQDSAVIRVDSDAKGQLVAHRIKVEVGLERGTSVEVRGELQEGDRVVASGADRLQAGQPLLIAEP